MKNYEIKIEYKNNTLIFPMTGKSETMAIKNLLEIFFDLPKKAELSLQESGEKGWKIAMTAETVSWSYSGLKIAAQEIL